MKALLLALANELHNRGVDLYLLDGEPMTANWSGPNQSGVYLRKHDLSDWTQDEIATIKELTPFIYGVQAVGLAEIDQTDSDDDRIYRANFKLFEMPLGLATEIRHDMDGEMSPRTYYQMCMN